MVFIYGWFFIIICYNLFGEKNISYFINFIINRSYIDTVFNKPTKKCWCKKLWRVRTGQLSCWRVLPQGLLWTGRKNIYRSHTKTYKHNGSQWRRKHSLHHGCQTLPGRLICWQNTANLWICSLPWWNELIWKSILSPTLTQKKQKSKPTCLGLCMFMWMHLPWRVKPTKKLLPHSPSILIKKQSGNTY